MTRIEPMSERIIALTRPLDPHSHVDVILERFTDLAGYFAERSVTRIHLPFLQAYRRSSRCLSKLLVQEEESAAPLRQLAIDFANRYLLAMRCVLVTGRAQAPWRTYFDYTHHTGRDPLLALLLGVKSHVSGDLPSSLRSTGLDDHLAFCAFDTSLRALSPEAVEAALAYGGANKNHPLSARPGLVRTAYDLSVRRWRAQAWSDRDADGYAEATERSCRRLIMALDPLWLAKRPLRLASARSG